MYGADVLGLASSDSLADAQAAASAHAKHYLDELAKGLPAGIEHQTAVFVYGSDLEDVGHAIIAYAQKVRRDKLELGGAARASRGGGCSLSFASTLT